MNSLINWLSKSDIGTREEQQDCSICYEEKELFAAVVCDGMGGLNGGSTAGKCAAEGLVQLIRNRENRESIPDLFLRSIDILDERVSQLKNEFGEKQNAGTTIVAVAIEKNKLFWLSVGDSRLYLMRQNELVQATRDHNYSLVLESMPGNYVPDENEQLKKDALVSFVGMGGIEIMDISRNPVMLIKNDIILLTTDGLYKALTDKQIKEILIQNSNVREIVDELMAQAKKASPDSLDNTTFVLIKYRGE